MDTKRSSSHQTRNNFYRRRAAIVFGIVMTMPDAPATDTLEYLALKMVIKHWPNAQVDHSKGWDKIDRASKITKSLLLQRKVFSSNRVNNAVFRAEFNIRRAIIDFRRCHHHQAPLPNGFLLSAVEHSLINEYRPWRELISEAH